MMDALAKKYGHSPAAEIVELIGIFDTTKEDGKLDTAEVEVSMTLSSTMIVTCALS